ncbi:aldo/keto reductase [Salinarimonas soli]|uniref:Aldo/keto reductase n=1 Tax=Salinarimonas soli TaxID=1638099 RepID=A0A5B2V935_9HYPH|nr:aldo/keto reductase [Salinarimonas soli]KAA2235336.1 aldo/keto reductase [Salinarimonas soli]
MTAAHLVQASGAAIPAIGLGTWPLKGEDCSRAVAEALRVGYRHIDTAAMYGNEEAVGAGLKSSGLGRDEVFVTTKVWYEEIAPGRLERSAEASLRRLGLDQVDLLLIHWLSPDVSVEDSVGALCNAKRQGLARHVGISNHPVALMRRALSATTEPLVANQCEYHPRLEQSAVLAACREAGMAFVSYSPIGRGDLSDDPVVTEIAARHGKTSVQILLRWHVQQPGVVAIPKSGNPTRIAENLAVFDFSLSEEEMARLHGMARPDGRKVAPDFAPRWD